MTNVEKIRAEIERLKETVGAGLDAYDMGHENGAFEAYEKVLSFIDSLPEETCDDLEQEIRLYHEEMEGAIHYTQCARHFAQWQEERLINKACEWWRKDMSYPSMAEWEYDLIDEKVGEFRKAMEDEE